MAKDKDKNKASIDHIDLMPDAGIYEGLSRSGYARDEAINEYGDNSIDELSKAMKEGREPSNPCIRFIFDVGAGGVGEITVEDNMGGIKFEDIGDALRAGKLGSGKESTIGYFGLGLKAAGLSLGDINLATWKPGDPMGGTYIEMKKDMLTHHAQNMPVIHLGKEGIYTLPDGRQDKIAPGWTRFIFRNLKREHSFTTDDAVEYRKKLGQTYGILVTEKYPKLKMTVVIKHGDHEKPEDVEFQTLDSFREELIDDSIFNPDPELACIDTDKLTKKGLEELMDDPAIRVREIDGAPKVMIDDAVSVRCIVGLLWRGSPALDYGADVYMNRRMISRYDKISFSDSDGGSDDNAFGKPHASLARMRALVFIEGPAEKTPSNFSKKALDRANPLYNRLRRVIGRLYGHYKEQSTKWESDLNPVLVQHRMNIVTVYSDTPNKYLARVVSQAAGGSEANERRKEKFEAHLPALLPLWESDKKKKALVDYVKQNFDTTVKPPQPKKARTKRKGTDKDKMLSVRKTPEVNRLLKAATDICQTELRLPDKPGATIVVTEALKHYVKCVGGKD